jgi:hypothetical protein
VIRTFSIFYAALVLCACGGGGSSGGVTLQATTQTLVSSNGDQTRYAGNWSSCTLQANGQFSRNNISFSLSGPDLLFTPSTGIVGWFSDAQCTLAVAGQTMGISSINPLRISLIKTIDIVPQSNVQFSGRADELPDLGYPNFKFAGFSADYKSVWFSLSSSFSDTVTRYDKK